MTYGFGTDCKCFAYTVYVFMGEGNVELLSLACVTHTKLKTLSCLSLREADSHVTC